MKKLSIQLAVSAVISTSYLQAEEAVIKEAPRLGVGFALYAQDMGYDTDDMIGLGQIYLEYHGEKLNLDHENISYKLFEKNSLSFDVLAKSRIRGFEEDHDKLFEGMEDRDPALELGGRVSMNHALGRVSLELLADPDTAHEGELAILELDRTYQMGGWSIKPTVGVTWQSEEVTDYYYGVRDSEVTASRAAFKGESAIIPHVDVDFVTNLGKNWKAGLNLDYQYLPDEITDSPLVDDSKSLSLSGRVAYFF